MVHQNGVLRILPEKKIKKKSAAGWRKQCNRGLCTLYCYQILELSYHGEQVQDMQHAWEIQDNNIKINFK
jgi:hypothetical protein